MLIHPLPVGHGRPNRRVPESRFVCPADPYRRQNRHDPASATDLVDIIEPANPGRVSLNLVPSGEHRENEDRISGVAGYRCRPGPSGPPAVTPRGPAKPGFSGACRQGAETVEIESPTGQTRQPRPQPRPRFDHPAGLYPTDWPVVPTSPGFFLATPPSAGQSRAGCDPVRGLPRSECPLAAGPAGIGGEHHPGGGEQIAVAGIVRL